MAMLSPSFEAALSRHFPVASACLLPYLRRVDAEHGEAGALHHKHYAALVRLLCLGGIDTRRALNFWKAYEEQFRRSMAILGMSTPDDFSDSFEFEVPARQMDGGALGDLITEVLYAVDLGLAGFVDLRKLPRSNKRKRADFSGAKDGVTFAIEVKAIRGGGSFMTPVVQIVPEELRAREARGHARKLLRKIALKDDKAVKQLLDTKAEFALDRTMLAVQSDHVGMGAALEGALSVNDATSVTSFARTVYSEIDHIAYKWMVTEPTPIVIDPPA